MPVIQTEITRLYQLAWQPGAVMHAQWWSFLQLVPWRAYYFTDQNERPEGPQGVPLPTQSRRDKSDRSRSTLRRLLDRLICHKRGYPLATLPARLSVAQRHLLALEPRLNGLLVALGVQLLGSPDYLLRGQYRRVLAPVLGWQALEQLWTLWPGGDRQAILTPQALLSQALQCGYCAINSQLRHDPVWQAVAVTLPPPGHSTDTSTRVVEEPLPRLLKLARFL